MESSTGIADSSIYLDIPNSFGIGSFPIADLFRSDVIYASSQLGEANRCRNIGRIITWSDNGE